MKGYRKARESAGRHFMVGEKQRQGGAGVPVKSRERRAYVTDNASEFRERRVYAADGTD